jgi:hypothetical protein
MGQSQRTPNALAIGGISSDNQKRTAVVTNRVFSRMVIAVVLGCVSMVAPAEAQLNTQHIKGTVCVTVVRGFRWYR